MHPALLTGIGVHQPLLKYNILSMTSVPRPDLTVDESLPYRSSRIILTLQLPDLNKPSNLTAADRIYSDKGLILNLFLSLFLSLLQ